MEASNIGGVSMKKCGNILYGVSDSVMKVIAFMALAVTGLAVNHCCMWFLGQDELPENAKKLKRF